MDDVTFDAAPPRFVTFEGPEGAGKSTVARLVVRELELAGLAVSFTREPGGTELGRRLRETLLASSSSIHVDTRAELLMFLADRAQHVAQVIRPALESGQMVVCDRYVHSTLAYQGFGRGLDLVELSDMVRFATDGLLPDLVVLVDIDPALGQSRVTGRGSPDRIESAGLEFHRRVRDGFVALADADAERFLVLDGAAELSVSVAKVLKRLLVHTSAC